jgi:hypothetical protein
LSTASELVFVVEEAPEGGYTARTAGRVRLPRDLDGRETMAGEHRVTVPAGGPLRVGTLAAILAEVATHHGVSRPALEQRPFG